MSDDVKLPALPFPYSTIETRSGDFDVWLEGQLRAYGEACRQDEREKCAQLCNEQQVRCPEGEDDYEFGWNGCCEAIEKEIRERVTL